VNYENGPFGLFTSFNYTGKVKVDPDTPDNFYEHPTRSAVMYVNSGVSFDVGNRLTFRVLVDNILNAGPPKYVPAGGGVITYFPGVLGRYYRFGAGLHF
jgi:hypothetical protein